MADGVLGGCSILIAEDDYFIASDTAQVLREAGGTVIGPVGTVIEVEERLAAEQVDVAVLDIRLHGEVVYPAADHIIAAGVPMAFLTGYDDAAIPPRFDTVPRCPKPCSDQMLVEAVRGLYAQRLASASDRRPG